MQVALRTVAVTRHYNRRSVTVNALLNDGSTQSCLNSAVAAELAIHAQLESITVSTLNSQTRTMDTMPVHLHIESRIRTFRSELHATTAERITADCQVGWPALRKQNPLPSVEDSATELVRRASSSHIIIPNGTLLPQV